MKSVEFCQIMAKSWSKIVTAQKMKKSLMKNFINGKLQLQWYLHCFYFGK